MRKKSIGDSIADLIVRGDLKPGDRLEEQALAERFNVSRTPIREVIQQLASSGLVQLRPRRSAIVRRMSQQELGEAFEAMGELEGLCAYYAAQRLSEAQRLQLKALMEMSQRVSETGTGDEAREIDTDFHELIHSGARNWMISAVARETRMKVSPYSALGFSLDSDLIDLRVPHQQHSRIAEAIIDGDATAARALMIEHIGYTYLALQQLLPAVSERDRSSIFAGEDD